MCRGSSAACALLALAALGCGPPRPADLILISIDTLRVDRLGAYGHAAARTPVLDALAREGVRFTAAATTFPRTTPALASLHTGLYPKHHGSREVGQPFETGRTLAQRLAAAGFATAGVVGNVAAGERQNLNRGFERFESSRHDPSTRRALALARRADPERPLFLWVHYREPHFPYEPPPQHAPPDSIRACADLNRAVVEQRLTHGALWTNHAGLAERAFPDCARAYDGEIAVTDALIGELLSGLRELGRLERAFVVVTADHGENLGEAGLWYDHGTNVHEASLRIPLLVSGPGLRPGVRDEPVQLEDLAPTLLSLLGVAGPRDGFDGVDLSTALLSGAPAAAERVTFAEAGSALDFEEFAMPFSGRAEGLHCWNEGRFSLCARPGQAAALYDNEADPELRHDLGGRHPELRARLGAARRLWPPETLRERSARAGRFKWVEIPRLDGGYTGALRDLERDPGETRDASAEHPEPARRLAAALAAWHAPLPPPPARPDDVVEGLRALGYVQ